MQYALDGNAKHPKIMLPMQKHSLKFLTKSCEGHINKPIFLCAVLHYMYLMKELVGLERRDRCPIQYRVR